MSVFNRAWDATKRTAQKISNKTEELLDSATTSIKIKNLEAKIEEQYELLGRIVYRDLHTEDDLEEEKLKAIATIDALFDRISELKAAKAAKQEAKEPAEEECCPCDTCEACEAEPEAEQEEVPTAEQ